jgi:hypothetical protein
MDEKLARVSRTAWCSATSKEQLRYIRIPAGHAMVWSAWQLGQTWRARFRKAVGAENRVLIGVTSTMIEQKDCSISEGCPAISRRRRLRSIEVVGAGLLRRSSLLSDGNLTWKNPSPLLNSRMTNHTRDFSHLLTAIGGPSKQASSVW